MSSTSGSLSASPAQLHAMSITERVISSLSVTGILFILSTYLFASGFNKPINRLVFFASWGNLGMNIASFISENGPAAGSSSSLCQFQAFMVQMFLGVDAYWSLCMALNVYLVFFGQYNVQQLRRLDFRYILSCYGLALVPAVTFIFINTEDRGRMYGNAVLWCWISSGWDFLRIALVYSISWLAITMAFVVYAMAAYNVWTRRHELQGNVMNPFNETPLKSVVVTEISVTSESRQKSCYNAETQEFEESDGYDPYSVKIDVGGAQEGESDAGDSARPGLLQMRSLTRNAANVERNTEALLYARSAFFYFIALLIIWIPSSINRAYTVANPSVFNFALNYISSLLLSSQGFLNVIVYIVTSRSAVQRLWHQLGRRGDRKRRRGDLGIPGGGSGVVGLSCVGSTGGEGGSAQRLGSFDQILGK